MIWNSKQRADQVVIPCAPRSRAIVSKAKQDRFGLRWRRFRTISAYVVEDPVIVRGLGYPWR